MENKSKNSHVQNHDVHHQMKNMSPFLQDKQYKGKESPSEWFFDTREQVKPNDSSSSSSIPEPINYENVLRQMNDSGAMTKARQPHSALSQFVSFDLMTFVLCFGVLAVLFYATKIFLKTKTAEELAGNQVTGEMNLMPSSSV
ncbi:MAG TPA: hypothetical protein VIL29_07575 [Pseudothermotoga sp.]